MVRCCYARVNILPLLLFVLQFFQQCRLINANETQSVWDACEQSPLMPSEFPVFAREEEQGSQFSKVSMKTRDQSNEYLQSHLQFAEETQPASSNDSVSYNDSVIDECHFMSFEEWKKHKIGSLNNGSRKLQNNSKTTGQAKKGKLLSLASASVSASGSSSKSILPLSSSSQLSASAASLGLSASTSSLSYSSLSSSSLSSKKSSAESVDTPKEEKPLNGKVYKDKFNFASIDCGATVVETNAQAKGASAILKENKDTYLLNECSVSNQYVIIELCQDILVGQVALANYEFFSSMFRDVKISVSDRFPASSWKVIGNYMALNTRELHVFNIKNPLIWARYLKVEITSHYGNEFYCPISLIRVHGKTMIDELKEDEENNKQGHEFVVEELEEVLEETLTTKPSSVGRDDNDSLLPNESYDECRVILPHLRLNEFLKDFNASDSDTNLLCLPTDMASGATGSSASLPISTAHTSSITTTQDSIYKNFMKRLSLLESNATLSLLYIEEQLKLLSTAFSNLERRQNKKFNQLVTSVNATLMHQLISFKDSYDLLHRQYRDVLKTQAQSYKQHLVDTTREFEQFKEELTFQRRIVIFNSLLIIFLLTYLVLTRDVDFDVQQQKNVHLVNHEPASISDTIVVPSSTNHRSRNSSLHKNGKTTT